MVGAFALAFEQHVRLADSVRLGVDLLTVEQALDGLGAPRADRRERLLPHCEHAARAAGTVVEQIGTGLDLRLDGQENEVRHQANGVARCPVFARFFVVILVELADQLLEDGPHRMIVDASRREVDVGVEELVDHSSDGVGLGQRLQLIAELEVLDDVLNIRREAVEVIFEVGEELLLTAAGLQIAQRELRGVVERLAGGLGECGTLFGDAGLVALVGAVVATVSRRLKHGVHTADNAHRQDHVRVFAALEQVSENIVGYAPYKGDNPVVRCLVQYCERSFSIISLQW